MDTRFNQVRNDDDSRFPVKYHHLSYLDGLRGLAALYVVLTHACLEVTRDHTFTEFPFFIQKITDWLGFGAVAVDIFIVLSGYCLMLPVARSKGKKLHGGVSQYLFRRARRILPPYYIALVLSLLLIAIVPGMNQIEGKLWDMALTAFTPSCIVSHLLLVHNLTGCLFTIDPPMWSVAIESQIYFLFPLLLLPVWRRFGNIITIIVGFVIGLSPHFLLHKGDTSCPWFLGLFTLGMVAAVFNVSYSIPPKQLSRWSLALCVFTLTLFLLAIRTMCSKYITDTLAGFTTAFLLVFLTNHCYQFAQSPKPFLLKLMESPGAVLLGTFSYSLYLIHFPILSLFHLWIRPLHLSAIEQLALLLTVGTLISIILSYIFHLLFERRFMPGSPMTLKQAIDAVKGSPAP